MTIEKNNKRDILLDENLIGSDPFIIRELIRRGYHILPLAHTDTLLDTQERTMQIREVTIERRFKL